MKETDYKLIGAILLACTICALSGYLFIGLVNDSFLIKDWSRPDRTVVYSMPFFGIVGIGFLIVYRLFSTLK